jgi:hypothetical protein
MIYPLYSISKLKQEKNNKKYFSENTGAQNFYNNKAFI